MKDIEIRIRNHEERYIDEPVIVKTGKEKRRERRVKERKNKFGCLK
jgi:hypothetical protein